jgi:hypothetical protein
MAPASAYDPGSLASPGDQASFRLDVLEGCAVVAASGEVDVTFLDSTDLGVMILALRYARDAEGSLCLVGPITKVRRVLEITRLDEVFVIHPDLEEAVA